MDIPVHRFKDERITDVRRGGPNPEHLRFRAEWRLPHADRTLHYTWTGTTTFIVDVDNMSEGYAPTTPLDSDHEGAGDALMKNLLLVPLDLLVLVFLLDWHPRRWRDRLPLFRFLVIIIKHLLLKIDELLLLEKKYKIYQSHLFDGA